MCTFYPLHIHTTVQCSERIVVYVWDAPINEQYTASHVLVIMYRLVCLFVCVFPSLSLLFSLTVRLKIKWNIVKLCGSAVARTVYNISHDDHNKRRYGAISPLQCLEAMAIHVTEEFNFSLLFWEREIKFTLKYIWLRWYLNAILVCPRVCQCIHFGSIFMLNTYNVHIFSFLWHPMDPQIFAWFGFSAIMIKIQGRKLMSDRPKLFS